MIWTKIQRLEEFQRRLRLAPPAVSHDSAMQLVASLLDAIEDAYSGVPPASDAANSFQVDGRMYPPHERFREVLPGRPELACYRQKGHRTLIAENGAIRIELKQLTEGVISWKLSMTKPGADGKEIE